MVVANKVNYGFIVSRVIVLFPVLPFESFSSKSVCADQVVNSKSCMLAFNSAPC